MLLLLSSLHSWQLSFRGRVTISWIALWLSFACIPGSVPGLVSGSVSGFMMEPDDLYWPRLWLHHEARTHSTGSMMEPVAIGWIWSIVIGVAKYHMAVLKRWTIAPPQKSCKVHMKKCVVQCRVNVALMSSWCRGGELVSCIMWKSRTGENGTCHIAAPMFADGYAKNVAWCRIMSQDAEVKMCYHVRCKAGQKLSSPVVKLSSNVAPVPS